MQKPYALFDFDGTLISGDSLLLFLVYARKKGLCSAGNFWQAVKAGLRYALGLSTAQESKAAVMAFLKGHSREALLSFSVAFCEKKLRPRLRKQGLAELEALRKKNVEILLITASPAFYLDPLKDVLGVAAIIGTRVDFDQAGNATGLICGENCKGLQKPLRLAEYLAATGSELDYAGSSAYGDSASDMPMLALCQRKVGVNARRGLRRELQNAEGAELVHW